MATAALRKRLRTAQIVIRDVSVCKNAGSLVPGLCDKRIAYATRQEDDNFKDRRARVECSKFTRSERYKEFFYRQGNGKALKGSLATAPIAVAKLLEGGYCKRRGGEHRGYRTQG